MIDPIKSYYENYDEDGRLLSRSGSVEFFTTKRYIDRYIKPGDSVLEIGAGTGRYSHAFARLGYSVDAVELIEHNINIFRQNITPGESVTIRQGNAMDLSFFDDNTYDITLLLGPMYHLFTAEDKLTALREAIRVTKPGGVIFTAYCISDLSVLVSGFKRRDFSVVDMIEKGFIDPVTFAASSEPSLYFEIVRKEHIDDLMAQLPAARLHYVASDGYTYHMRDEINAMEDAEFDLYLKYHFATCERADMVGLSAHTIDIFRKD